MIGAIMERKPCRCFPPLFNGDALPAQIFNVEDPIAFGTTELEYRAALGIRNHLPHWTATSRSNRIRVIFAWIG